MLPRAGYLVFVRGYGLVDSSQVTAKPGQHLGLKAVVAADGRAGPAEVRHQRNFEQGIAARST